MVQKRLWDRARELRPGIFSRGRSPLLETYCRSNGIELTNQYLSWPDFRRFFEDSAGHITPTKRYGIRDAYAYVSAALGGRERYRHVQHDRLIYNWSIKRLSGIAFSLYGAFRNEGKTQAEAAQMALRAVDLMFEDIYRLFSGDSVQKSKYVMRAAKEVASELSDVPRKGRGSAREERIQDLSFGLGLSVVHNRVSIDATGVTHGPIRALMFGKKSLFEFYPFDYADFAMQNSNSRFLGIIVGKRFVSGFDVWRSKKVPKNAIAIIGVYPWEADHIAKAAEIAKRGIPVAEPVGRALAGEIELALFRWVHGKALNNISEQTPWREYGKIIRMCHERGVQLDDAAGRNAIWTGDRIKLIDFEHTLLTEDIAPLPESDRQPSLERLYKEINHSPVSSSLIEAFNQGYQNKT